MSDRSLYRSRAIARRDEPEPIDAVPRVTAPHEWAIVAGLLVLVIVALAWAIFGRVEVRSTVEGVLVRPGERKTIVSALTGTVTEVLAQPGQAVAAGAPVVRLEPAGLDLQIRIARTTEELLTDLLDRSAQTTPAALQTWLAHAIATRLELTALQTAGSVVVSPRSGALTALHVAAGDTVQAGATIADLRSDADGPVTAITLISAEQAGDVRPGMGARILFEQAGEQRALQAAVTTVAEPGQPPAWLRVAPIAERTHREAGTVLVTFALATPHEALAVDDLWPCRVEIVRQRVAPLALLAAGRGS